MISGDAWRGYEGGDKLALLSRLRELSVRTHTGTYGDQPTPGALAVACDQRVVQRPHLELIDQAFADVKAGLIDRVIICTPPQVGKSLRTVWGIFWWLTHRPYDEVILMSYGAHLAATRGRMVRGLIREHGAGYGLRMDPEKSATNDWALTCGGAMHTGGMRTGITGVPGNLMVIDDAHKDRAEADSPELRAKIWDTYSSSLLSRLSPGAPIIIVNTRWHPDDLTGRVIKAEGIESEGGRWRLLNLAALATAGDALGREIGDPLPHPKLEVIDTAGALAHWQEKKRTSTVRDWYALYQGDPQPAEGALLTEEMCRERRCHALPEATRAAVAVDPSGGGRDDAGLVGGFAGDDGKVYWTHDRSGVMSADQWSRGACLLAYEIGADLIVFEHNYGGDTNRLVIRTAWDALVREGEVEGPCPRIKAVSGKRGKFLRAEPIAQQVIEDRVRFGADLVELVRQWTTWQIGSPWSPGNLDAAVYLVFALIKVPGADALIGNPSEARKTPTGRSSTAARRIR